LGQILLGSIPTFVLVWILYIYISRAFYGPLQQTLRKRQEETEGLRKTAASAVTAAEQKMAQYQEALRKARAQMYEVQEDERQRALDRRAEIVHQAHERAQQLVAEAKQALRGDAEAAKNSIAADAEQIANSITNAILRPASHRRAMAASVGRSGGLD